MLPPGLIGTGDRVATLMVYVSSKIQPWTLSLKLCCQQKILNVSSGPLVFMLKCVLQKFT